MELNDVDIEVLSTLGNFKCEKVIDAGNATTVNLPKLQESWTINASKATTVNLPNLQKAGSIEASKATTLNLPNLQQAGYIHADNATTLNLPNLQKAGDIGAYNAKKIIIPSYLKHRLQNVPDDCEIIHPDLDSKPKLESFKSFFYKYSV